MIAIFKQKWWKVVGAGLLFYILIGGMLVPLGAGLKKIEPFQLQSNKINQLTVTGYHTHFQSGKKLQVWLKNGLSNFYSVQNLAVQGEEQLSFNFALDKTQLPANNAALFDLIINSDKDGTIALRDAITMTPGDSSLIVTSTLCKPHVNLDQVNKFCFPYREILYESIRNTFYHVPLWFGMMLTLIFSLVFSIRYLLNGNLVDDIIASEAIRVSLLFGVLGICTGMMWATFTWGKPWPKDAKLDGAAVGVLVYLAYIVLRGSFTDEIKRAKISAVYSIFAIVIFVLFIFILPRLQDSLHPGNGGNPAFSKYDLDSHLRLFFYPAVIGWFLIGFWILSLNVRIQLIEFKRENK